MPAYYKNTLNGFLKDKDETILRKLTSNYANDGFYQLLGTQIKSWEESLPLIHDLIVDLHQHDSTAGTWGVLLEYPLYRLRKRIDLMLISRKQLYIIELKVGATDVENEDIRQVEEYALDLRDFHKASHTLSMSPFLCCTELAKIPEQLLYDSGLQIQPVCVTSKSILADIIIKQNSIIGGHLKRAIDWEAWEQSSYEPVPTIIEAATTIFANHGVKEISRSDADNLVACSQEVVRLVHETRDQGKKRIIVVTGVPGAGKTLAGLNVVHTTKDEGEKQGKVIYLSGNTPLVVVIREALAQDEYNRSRLRGGNKTLGEIRHKLMSRIQHINDFLKEYYSHDLVNPPFENAIVFDEAQRAWDHKQGKDKFGRDASEPELLMKIMERHQGWAAIICLVGAGQEINKGEPGMQQWGEALSKFHDKWEMIAPRSAVEGSDDTAGTSLFPQGVPSNIRILHNEALKLTVPIRSYRSEMVSKWVDAVLDDRPNDARQIAEKLGKYPITLVRSLMNVVIY